MTMHEQWMLRLYQKGIDDLLTGLARISCAVQAGLITSQWDADQLADLADILRQDALIVAHVRDDLDQRSMVEKGVSDE